MPRTAVNVDLRARDRTKAAFASAQRGLDGLLGRGNRLAGLFSRAGPIGAGIASIGIAAGLAVRALVKVVDELDNIDKASKRVGVSAEELQALRLAAQLGGAEINQTDIALQRFSRRLGEAAQGSGELLGTLERMNIRVRGSDGALRSNVDVLDEYVEKVREMGSTQEQTLAIFKAFDSEGVRFGRALVENERRVSELTDAFREQGLVIEGRYVRQAAAAKDALTLLNAQWKVATTELLIQFLPALQSTIPVLQGLAREVAKLANSLGDLFDVRPNEELLDEIESLTAVVEARRRLVNREGARPSAAYLAELASLEARLAGLVAELDKKREAANDAVLKQAAAFGGADPTIRELAEAQLRAEEKSLAVRRELLRLKREQKLITEEEYQLELRKLAGAAEQAKVEKTIEEIARDRLDAAAKEEAVQREINRILAERAKVFIDIGNLTQEQLDRLREIFGSAEDAGELDQQAISRKEKILELTRGIADALAGFTDSTEGWLRLIGQALRLWQQFEFGGSGGTLGGTLGGILGPVQTPGGSPPVGNTTNNTLIFQGSDFAANFREQVNAQAPYILNELGAAARG